MEQFYLELNGRPDEYSLMQLERLLKPSGAKLELLSPSLPGTKDYRLSISYDRASLRRFETRNAGRKSLDAELTIPVAELERMISELGAKEAAAQLGFSRATMYRRLKRAKENGYTLIW